VRDTVVAPRLAVRDGPAVEEEGELRLSSASSRLGCREPKLRRRCAAALLAAPGLRPAMEVRIQRVARKESRKRTLLTAVRSVPSSDAGRFSRSIGVGRIEARFRNATRLVLVPRFRSRR
jgi:hypothetical protein